MNAPKNRPITYSLKARISTRRIVNFVLTISGLLCALAIFTTTTLAQQLEPPQIVIEKMIRAYSQLSSYQGTGVAEKETGVPPNVTTRRTQFSQWIKKPRLERVEWMDVWEGGYSQNGFLVSNEYDISLYHSHGNAYTQRSSKNNIERAGILGIAFGSTETSTFTIRNLILGNAQRNQLNHLDNLKLEKIENIESSTCYVIIGSAPSKTVEFKLWIDTSDYLIRRIESFIKSTAKLRASITEELRNEGMLTPNNTANNNYDTTVLIKESHSDIIINSDIPNGTFDFIPPAGSTFSSDMSYYDNKTKPHGIFAFIVNLFVENRSYIIFPILVMLILIGCVMFAIRRAGQSH